MYSLAKYFSKRRYLKDVFEQLLILSFTLIELALKIPQYSLTASKLISPGGMIVKIYKK